MGDLEDGIPIMTLGYMTDPNPPLVTMSLRIVILLAVAALGDH